MTKGPVAEEKAVGLEDDWQLKVRQWLESGQLRQATLSQPRRKTDEVPFKIVIRALKLRGDLHYQFEFFKNKQVTHENVSPESAGQRAIALMNDGYRQGLFRTDQVEGQLLLSKKGKARFLIKALETSDKSDKSDKSGIPEHDRPKQRVLPEGEAVPFLVALGIMSPSGKVYTQKQDKYRQINRFLEIVLDALPALPKGRTLQIVDFGCGKSYLTFALYHLLVVEQQRSVRIVGLDLKADVIAWCNKLAQQLAYDSLTFLHGDIAAYEGLTRADMVVTLHACDTATDAALAKAVRWQSTVILSVPCCQHEAFRQINNVLLEPLLGHGLLKERFAALATDAARARLLEVVGYRTQIVEFVDPEHTPKNLLIRAVRAQLPEAERLKAWTSYEQFRDGLCLQPSLESGLAGLLPSAARR